MDATNNSALVLPRNYTLCRTDEVELRTPSVLGAPPPWLIRLGVTMMPINTSWKWFLVVVQLPACGLGSKEGVFIYLEKGTDSDYRFAWQRISFGVCMNRQIRELYFTPYRRWTTLQIVNPFL